MDYGNAVWNAGLRYRAQDPNMLQRYREAGLPPRAGDTPAVPTSAPPAEQKPSAIRQYLNTSASQLARIPQELGRNLADLASRYGPAAAETAAGALPGAGWVQSTRDYGNAAQALQEGNYGQAALHGGQGLANQLLEFVPGMPTLAVAGAVASRPSAEALEQLQKTYWSPQSKTKLTVPLEDMSATRVPTGELAPRRTISPEALQGSMLMHLPGDRTMAGHTLTRINDQDLAFPVDLQGGPDYMRSAASQGPDASVWASGANVIGNKVKFANDLAERYGRDVNMVYTNMAGTGGDFSHMMSDALLAQIPGAKIRPQDLREFDRTIRGLEVKNAKGQIKRPGEDWRGFDDIDALREQLLDPARGDLRKTFAELAATGQWQKRGMPDIGSTRWAITDPNLVTTPNLQAGYAIARARPGTGRIDNPAIPHRTYPTQMSGDYVGGLEQMVPSEVMFPSWFEASRAAGRKPMSSAEQKAFRDSNVQQYADQQWLDNIMTYLEQQRGGR